MFKEFIEHMKQTTLSKTLLKALRVKRIKIEMLENF